MSNLRRAYAKVKHHSKRVWCGYLTASEVVAIVGAGAKPEASNTHIVERARTAVAEGEAKPTWFYFTPSKEMLDRLVKS